MQQFRHFHEFCADIVILTLQQAKALHRIQIVVAGQEYRIDDLFDLLLQVLHSLHPTFQKLHRIVRSNDWPQRKVIERVVVFNLMAQLFKAFGGVI